MQQQKFRVLESVQRKHGIWVAIGAPDHELIEVTAGPIPSQHYLWWFAIREIDQCGDDWYATGGVVRSTCVRRFVANTIKRILKEGRYWRNGSTKDDAASLFSSEASKQKQLQYRKPNRTNSQGQISSSSYRF